MNALSNGELAALRHIIRRQRLEAWHVDPIAFPGCEVDGREIDRLRGNDQATDAYLAGLGFPDEAWREMRRYLGDYWRRREAARLFCLQPSCCPDNEARKEDVRLTWGFRP